MVRDLLVLHEQQKLVQRNARNWEDFPCFIFARRDGIMMLPVYKPPTNQPMNQAEP
jgi:hypothetical protein